MKLFIYKMNSTDEKKLKLIIKILGEKLYFQ